MYNKFYYKGELIMTNIVDQIINNQNNLSKQHQLRKELDQINRQIEDQQEACDHIRVCVGWDGPFLYRDTSICKCLLCGENEPESKYPLIEAYNYKSDLYGHGEGASYREARLLDLQNLALNILNIRENITVEQLIEIMKDIIKNPISSKYEDLAIACKQYPEVQLEERETGLSNALKKKKLFIRDTSYIKEEAKVVEIKKSPEHDKLVEEANERIEEGRRREAKAWHDAQSYITGTNEQGITRRLIPDKK